MRETTMTQGKLNWLVLGMAVVGLGFAMPSCPGQDAMQQEISALQSSNQELTKKVQTLTTQVTTLTNENNEIKKFMQKSAEIFATQEAVNSKIAKTLEEMKSKKRR